MGIMFSSEKTCEESSGCGKNFRYYIDPPTIIPPGFYPSDTTELEEYSL